MNKVAILWKFKLFDVALIWLRIRNLRPRISCIEPSLFIFDAYLLLAKISKKFASMFVWRFVTCQNLQFWQVCSFDGLSVCLSVCDAIQVAVFDQSSPNFNHLCSLFPQRNL